MSNQISTAMVDTFNTGLELLAQQTRSKLYERVRVEHNPGERNSFDQIGAVRARQKTGRHEDTKYINTPHKRRFVSSIPFEIADMLDKADIVRILNNPSGEYAKAFTAALNREKDTEVIRAGLGTAYTGKDGTTSVALPSSQKIADGGTGFTFTKVKKAMTIIADGTGVDPGEMEMTIAWTRLQEEEFMDNPEVKSIDYNTQKVLVEGTMGGSKFYGFNYVRLADWTDEDGVKSEIIPKNGAVRSCMAWVKNGILLNEPQELQTFVDRMPGKSQSMQIWCGEDFGGTRMQESMVVQIDAVEP